MDLRIVQHFICLCCIIILGCSAVVRSSRLQHLAQDNCPPGCSCSIERVDCINEGPTRPTDDSLFVQITAMNFPELDTLIIKGYNFSELDVHFNLFGSNEHHEYLTYLDLSNNSLRELHQNLLQGVPQLEQLLLDDNEIVEIGVDFFWKTPKLRALNISRAFNHQTNSAQRAAMLKRLFVTNEGIGPKHQNNFTELGRLDLSDNQLASIKPDMFCSILGEPNVNLANNLLTSINFIECPRGLRGLNLAGNLLQNIDQSTLKVFDTWEQLLPHSVDLSNNPWTCDCHIGPLIEWVFQNKDLLVNEETTICTAANPPGLQADSLDSIDQSALSCEERTITSHALSVSFLCLSLAAVSIIFAWFLVRNKETIAKKFQNSSNKQYVINKYSKLVDENSVEAPAEFV